MPESVEVAGDHPGKWLDSLGVHAVRINDRRQQSVGSEGDFQSKIVGPGTVGFSAFVGASAYVTRGGKTMTHIKEAQAKNLSGSFDKWGKSLDYIFETVDGVPAKRYKDILANKVDNTAVAWALKGMRITGDKIRGLGLATIAAYWLTGDNRGAALIRSDDIVISGSPEDTQTDGLQNAFKAAFVQKVIQAGMLISNSNQLAARLTEQNDILDAVCNGFRDDAKADEFNGTLAFCKYIVDTGKLYLHVKAILTP
jgi:hypothetical protein